MSSSPTRVPCPFTQEVIDAHIAIAQWLGGHATPEALSALLARFSPEFSMIALSGASVNRAALDTLFGQGHGKVPGLQITVDEFHTITTWPAGGIVGYRETQTNGENYTTVRRSTATFDRDVDGRIVWRHLHETSVSPG